MSKLERLRRGRLTAGDYYSLSAFESDAFTSLDDLADRMNCLPSDVAARVRRLRKAGLLVRRREGYHLTRAGLVAAWRWAADVAAGLIPDDPFLES
jgi:DNA-binding MarR family transcriptional regulator